MSFADSLLWKNNNKKNNQQLHFKTVHTLHPLMTFTASVLIYIYVTGWPTYSEAERRGAGCTPNSNVSVSLFWFPPSYFCPVSSHAWAFKCPPSVPGGSVWEHKQSSVPRRIWPQRWTRFPKHSITSTGPCQIKLLEVQLSQEDELEHRSDAVKTSISCQKATLVHNLHVFYPHTALCNTLVTFHALCAKSLMFHDPREQEAAIFWSRHTIVQEHGMFPSSGLQTSWGWEIPVCVQLFWDGDGNWLCTNMLFIYQIASPRQHLSEVSILCILHA